jgi:hypothetical protein
MHSLCWNPAKSPHHPAGFWSIVRDEWIVTVRGCISRSGPEIAYLNQIKE